MAKATMTHEEMVDVIVNQKGSILHDGAIINTVAGLPSPLELARTPEEKAQAVSVLDDQIKDLLAQRDRELLTPDKSAPVIEITRPIDDLNDANLVELLAIASSEGVEKPELYESKDALIAAIKQKAGYPAAPAPASPVDPAASTPAPVVPAPVPPVIETTETDTPPQGASTDADAALQSLTLDQLKQVAKESGVPSFETLNKKSDLIAAIKAQTEAKVATANAQGG